MPEVLGSPPSPRTALFWNGTEWQWALVDGAGHLQIDVLSTVMDPLAPTLVNQALVVAALQNIELLRNALESIATDRLIVRGEDQLFSIKEVLSVGRSAVISGAGGWVDSQTVPAGEYWVVTTISIGDNTSPTTENYADNRHDGVNVRVYNHPAALAQWVRSDWSGHTYLNPADTIRATFGGALAGDTCVVDLTGYRITYEV